MSQTRLIQINLGVHETRSWKPAQVVLQLNYCKYSGSRAYYSKQNSNKQEKANI